MKNMTDSHCQTARITPWVIQTTMMTPWVIMKGREVEVAMVQQCTVTENHRLATNHGQMKWTKSMTFDFVKLSWIPTPGGYSDETKG
jgi:hypothetical protein